jgi:hypothetical protein
LPHFGHAVFSDVGTFSRFTLLREGTRRLFHERWGEERKAARRIPPAPNRRFGYRWRLSQCFGLTEPEMVRPRSLRPPLQTRLEACHPPTIPLGPTTCCSYPATASGGCDALLPSGTSKTVNSVTLTTGATLESNMGKLMSSRDSNSNTSTFTYDLLGRP